MKPVTILRIDSIISSALDLAFRYDWADRNVAKKNASPPHPRKREPDPPSPDQAAELQRRGHEAALTQTPQPQSTLQWWQELEANIEAVDRALARQQQAAIDVGLPWPPVRHPAAQPEAERSPQLENSVPRQPEIAEPEPDSYSERAARLDELQARADDDGAGGPRRARR